MLNRRYGFSKKALLASAFFVACVPAFAACVPPGAGSAVEVGRVLDGDTLVLADGRHVRLIGVNTPELGRDGGLDEPYAQAARDELRRRLPSGKRLHLYPGREPRDRYGRTLAHLVEPDGRLLAESLIAAGLGFALAIEPNTRLADCLFGVERRARGLRLGLWRQAPVVRLDGEAALQAGFGIWQGRVTRVGGRGGKPWLVLDERVFVTLAPAVFDRLEELRGRRLEVRGWLIDRWRRGTRRDADRQRWVLSVRHSQHLRVLDG